MRTSNALDNTPLWQSLDFDFNQPGARARGIGGAFVGLADDASAAISNPAGLAQLNKIQIYTEGRFTDNDSSDKSWGSGTEADIQNDDISDFSYFALSAPLPIAKGYTITATAFYNKLAHTEGKLETEKFVFPVEFTGVKDSDFVTGYTASNDMRIDEFGLGLASSFWEGKVMVGGSVSLVHLDLDSKYSSNPGELSLDESIISNGSDSEVGWHFGMLFRPIERLTIGLSGNIMPKFRYDSSYNNIWYLDNFTYDTGTGKILNREYSIREGDLNETLNIPNSYSFGVSYKVNNYWTFFLEGKYIEYSQLNNDFDESWGGGGIPFGGESSTYSGLTGKYDIDSVWEPHFGTEYIFKINETPTALRLGTYYEPSHSLEYKAPNDPDIYGGELARAMENVLDGGDDVWHITVGTGVVLMNKLQLDVAADLSDNGQQNTFIASAVYQF